MPFPKNVEFHDHWLTLVACSMDGVNYVNIPILRYRQHGMNVTDNKKFSLLSKITEILTNKQKRNRIKDNRERMKRFLIFCKERCSTTVADGAIAYFNELVKWKKI